MYNMTILEKKIILSRLAYEFSILTQHYWDKFRSLDEFEPQRFLAQRHEDTCKQLRNYCAARFNVLDGNKLDAFMFL